MKRALLILSACLALMAQGPKEIPYYSGDNDGDPQHKDTPLWCQARDENGYRKNCGICERRCASDGSQQESPKCRVYCRKGACRCHPSCITMHKDKNIDSVSGSVTNEHHHS